MNVKKGSKNSRRAEHLYLVKKSRTPRLTRKGIMQIDYIVAVGMFIIVFALVLQYVSNYFSTVGDSTNIRVITAQATGLLSVVERGYYPDNWPQQTANDSVLLMHLDNSTLDATRYGNNGTISGANCSAAVLGRMDSGCEFDGIDDYIEVAASGSLSVRKDVTLEAWVYPLAGFTGDYRAIIYAGADGNSYNLLTNTGDGNLRAWFGGNALNSNTSLQAGTWSHVAATFDNTTIKLYINGILDNSSSASGSIVTGRPVTIGSVNAHNNYFFNGTIDEVVVWNRTLSADEVYNHWAYENLLDRIGLMTKAYRFYVILNNTQVFLKNQSEHPIHYDNELIKVNYTDLGIGADVPSTFVIDENNAPAAYNINGNTVTFVTDINPNGDKTFTVYFDDDSNFAEQSSTITGNDNLSETWTPPQAISVVQYRKLLFLNNSNYTRVKNATQLPRDFNIKLVDTGTSATILNFGPSAPPAGNVVSFRRFVLYQNSTGAMRRGRVTIQTW
ncbi:MAG TPA: LamG domain-containing protein [Candidatus Aenigmarchaeota archaeon]|nr:LamG domain-containing protein [Candidatus Aenigmarchaeota archaeon]